MQATHQDLLKNKADILNDQGLSARFALSSNGFSNDLETRGPNGTQLTLAEQLLRADTGYYNIAVGKGGPGHDDDKEEERRKREEKAIESARTIVEITSQTFSYGGMNLDYATTMSHMSGAIGYNEKFLKANAPREIQESDMLYVDRNGNMVSKDDPDARPVATIEEKKLAEDKNAACSIKSAIEETTLQEDGTRVSARDYLYGKHLADETSELIKAKQDIETGKVKFDDLPEHIKETIVQGERNKDNPRAEIADMSKMNLLEVLDIDDKKRQLDAASPKPSVAMDGPRPPASTFGM